MAHISQSSGLPPPPSYPPPPDNQNGILKSTRMSEMSQSRNNVSFDNGHEADIRTSRPLLPAVDNSAFKFELEQTRSERLRLEDEVKAAERTLQARKEERKRRAMGDDYAGAAALGDSMPSYSGGGGSRSRSPSRSPSRSASRSGSPLRELGNSNAMRTSDLAQRNEQLQAALQVASRQAHRTRDESLRQSQHAPDDPEGVRALAATALATAEITHVTTAALARSETDLQTLREQLHNSEAALKVTTVALDEAERSRDRADDARRRAEEQLAGLQAQVVVANDARTASEAGWNRAEEARRHAEAEVARLCAKEQAAVATVDMARETAARSDGLIDEERARSRRALEEAMALQQTSDAKIHELERLVTTANRTAKEWEDKARQLDDSYREEVRLRKAAEELSQEVGTLFMQQESDFCEREDRLKDALTETQKQAQSMRESALPAEDWLAGWLEEATKSLSSRYGIVGGSGIRDEMSRDLRVGSVDQGSIGDTTDWSIADALKRGTSHRQTPKVAQHLVDLIEDLELRLRAARTDTVRWKDAHDDAQRRERVTLRKLEDSEQLRQEIIDTVEKGQRGDVGDASGLPTTKSSSNNNNGNSDTSSDVISRLREELKDAQAVIESLQAAHEDAVAAAALSPPPQRSPSQQTHAQTQALAKAQTQFEEASRQLNESQIECARLREQITNLSASSSTTPPPPPTASRNDAAPDPSELVRLREMSHVYKQRADRAEQQVQTLSHEIQLKEDELQRVIQQQQQQQQQQRDQNGDHANDHNTDVHGIDTGDIPQRMASMEREVEIATKRAKTAEMECDTLRSELVAAERRHVDDLNRLRSPSPSASVASGASRASRAMSRASGRTSRRGGGGGGSGEDLARALEAESRVVQLTHELERANAAAEQAAGATESARGRADALAKRLQDEVRAREVSESNAEADRLELERELAETMNRARNVEADLSDTRRQLADVEGRLEMTTSRASMDVARLREREEEADRLLAERDEAREMIMTLEGRVQHLSASIDVFEEEAKRLRNQAETARTKLQTAETMRRRADGDAVASAQRARDAESSESAARAEANALRRRLEGTVSRLESSLENQEVKQVENDAAESRAKRLAKRLAWAESELESSALGGDRDDNSMDSTGHSKNRSRLSFDASLPHSHSHPNGTPNRSKAPASSRRDWLAEKARLETAVWKLEKSKINALSRSRGGGGGH